MNAPNMEDSAKKDSGCLIHSNKLSNNYSLCCLVNRANINLTYTPNDNAQYH